VGGPGITVSSAKADACTMDNNMPTMRLITPVVKLSLETSRVIFINDLLVM